MHYTTKYILALACIGVLNIATAWADPEVRYDGNDRSLTESRVGDAGQMREYNWARVPSYAKLGAFSTGDTGAWLTEGKNENLRRAIVGSAYYQRWVLETGRSILDFRYLDLREVDIARKYVTATYDRTSGLFVVNMPFVANLRYESKNNSLIQGTLLFAGAVRIIINTLYWADLPVVEVHAYKDVNPTARNLNMLGDYDQRFLKAMVIPVLTTQMNTPEFRKEWLATAEAYAVIRATAAAEKVELGKK